MNPNNLLQPPLSAQTFYILLALSRNQLHAYAIKNAVFSDSLGSVQLATGRLHNLVYKLRDEGLIEICRLEQRDASGKSQNIYTISEHGKLALQDEITRLKHAVRDQ